MLVSLEDTGALIGDLLAIFFLAMWLGNTGVRPCVSRMQYWLSSRCNCTFIVVGFLVAIALVDVLHFFLAWFFTVGLH